MDEQVKQKLMAYLEKLEGALNASTDFAIEQIPLVLQEYIAYQRLWSTLGVIAAFGFVGLFFFCLKYLAKETERGERCNPVVVIPCCMAMIVSFIAAPSMLGECTRTCLKSWVAPRVMLIDYIREGVK